MINVDDNSMIAFKRATFPKQRYLLPKKGVRVTSFFLQWKITAHFVRLLVIFGLCFSQRGRISSCRQHAISFCCHSSCRKQWATLSTFLPFFLHCLSEGHLLLGIIFAGFQSLLRYESLLFLISSNLIFLQSYIAHSACSYHWLCSILKLEGIAHF